MQRNLDIANKKTTFACESKKYIVKTFEELGVSPEIRRAIEEMGYAYPMPVQEEVIPYLLGENNDVVALAQTGTGKTAAFGLPLIQKINVEENYPQSLDRKSVV